eukprot:CAMPEP_0185731438 /NCGR_PEP_ID=MMETSP1171-20130828/12934_1 /TAXON_ID=374046 /ORGANISM="Helicotheca tamensis, Strain CCMP826" /LENGTH=356 /DNA_ID=CAMNT_0028400707 /DNA_START=106 /DNA_END=1176 /DNA_ORIENTATION=-
MTNEISQRTTSVTEGKGANSARSRRRQRRKDMRGNADENNALEVRKGGKNKPRNNKSNSQRGKPTRRTSFSSEKTLQSDCSSVTASLSDDSSSSLSATSSPTRTSKPQHEKTAKQPQKWRKKRLPKRNNKKKSTHNTAAATIVAVEKITEEEKARFVALDCEMVGVGPHGEQSALARVSIVNWDGDVIFDTFVKVDEPVTDYRTFVSGVREADIEYGMDFDECRERVKDILEDRIIVGHALKNDFHALDMTHPWHQIRDTARYEHFMKKSKTCPEMLLPKKLKVLAKDKLGMLIQEEGKEHCSVEDATAAMELYKKARRKWELAVEWKMKKTAEIVTLQAEETHEFYSSCEESVSQ